MIKKIVICISLLLLTGCSQTNNSTPSSNIDGVVILQVYGTGEISASSLNTPALSNSFIELYNTNDFDVDLSLSSIHYAEEGNEWSKLNLNGVIKSKSSFLIVSNDTQEYSVSEIVEYDMLWDVKINNKGIKVCLLNNTDTINVINPYNNKGNKINGYVDMVCATNNDGTLDAAEGMYITGQSKQKSVRRKNLVDTNDNSYDFITMDYSLADAELLDKVLPKSSSYGSYDPFEGLMYDVETNNDIVILQVYGTGNNTDSAINRSFIELYNTSDEDINLSNYSIHLKNKDNEFVKEVLTGTIKAKSSYLIAGRVMTTVNANLYIEEYDHFVDWRIDNKEFAVCLLSNTNDITTNPFNNGVIDGYVDMVGIDSSVFETTPFTGISKQKTARRISLDDTNNNSKDFQIIDFNITGTLTNEQKAYYSPKTTTYGSYDPFR